jgi:hypothetical protein
VFKIAAKGELIMKNEIITNSILAMTKTLSEILHSIEQLDIRLAVIAQLLTDSKTETARTLPKEDYD